MALVPSNAFPNRVITDDAGYTYGKALNIIGEQEGTGTPLRAEWVNDIWGYLQALLNEAGVTPSGNPDSITNSEYLKSTKIVIYKVIWGDRYAGVFSDGFEYTSEDQVGFTDDGSAYRYLGTLPYTVVADTDPTADPNYVLVTKSDSQTYDTVSEMVSSFTGGVCTTLAYNSPVKSMWVYTNSGAGDMSDGTLTLASGGFAKLIIEPLMDVRAFGTYGDHDPEANTYVNDDSQAIANAIKNCSKVTCTEGDVFAIANNIPCNYDNKIIDLSQGKFYWFGTAGPVRYVGRDRGMFEINGTISSQFATSGSWVQWLEGAETFPADDTTNILNKEFIILSVGAIPAGPSESYMVRPMPVRATVSDPNTRFQTDYRLGWTHSNATFRYFDITPVKNVYLSLGHVEDKTTYEYDQVDGSGDRLSASATVMEAAWNCHIDIKTSKNFQYPTVMTYYTTDCSVSNVFLLPSERVSLGIDGWGIVVQWNNALRPKSYNLSAQGNRRVLDYTQAAYAYAENIGGESTRDGEMTTHGSYEHNLTYVNTRGFMSFANSGAEFGESTKDITVIHHHGSDIFAVTNVINLSLKDCRCNSIRVNSVGLVMDNCSLYDLQTSVDNLCQINNWSHSIGKPYEIIKPTVVKNSSLNSKGVVFLVEDDMQPEEKIIFDNCNLKLRQGDFAANTNIVLSECELTGDTLVLVANPRKVELNDCRGYNVAFGILEPIVGTSPCKITFNGGEYIGENFSSAFWANRDTGVTALEQDNWLRMHDVKINWDFSTIFEDQIGQRNPWWYNKITNCEIIGNGTGLVRFPYQRGTFRFGDNTVIGVTLDMDIGVGGNTAERLEYNTIVATVPLDD